VDPESTPNVEGLKPEPEPKRSMSQSGPGPTAGCLTRNTSGLACKVLVRCLLGA
jgi:hypothetical protein